jgi:pyruvate dehydrogenase E2 component (dihydrolipoamide acetyltransferase)
MAIPVIMPRQGQSVETCIISRWFKEEGATVKKGDLLFSYETDKASFEFEAEEDGILLKIIYKEGDEVPVLETVAFIGEKGEPTGQLQPAENSKKTEEISLQETLSEVSDVQQKLIPEYDIAGRKSLISPRARNMAAKHGISFDQITGTGPNGRIIARDIEAVIQKYGPTEDAAVSRSTVLSSLSANDEAITATLEYEEKKLSNIRKIIALTMHESISNSAQLTHHMSADVRKLLELRKKIKSTGDSQQDITLNDMICFAVIKALECHPEMNSHFTAESIRRFKKIHLGFAVDTPRGLMVPAVLNASDLSLKGLSSRLHEIASLCRKGSINPEILSSTAASFTVSNLGSYGVEMFTPIINLPQVAILGVNTITYRPDDIGNGVFVFIPVIGLSLTYDHRAIDGGPATLFLKEIKTRIENFEIK